MISELDCKILTQACGLDQNTKRGVSVPYFTLPADWELVRVKVVMPNLDEFCSYVGKIVRCGNNYFEELQFERLDYILSKTPEELNQIVVNFIKTNPKIDGKHPFSWVTEIKEG